MIKNHYFSFPFFDIGVKTELFNWMYETMNVKLSFGTSGMKDDISKYHLHRIPFEKGKRSAIDIVKSEYFYFILKHFLGKNKIKRQ